MSRQEYEPVKDTGNARQRRQVDTRQLRAMGEGLSELQKPVARGPHAQTRVTGMGHETYAPGLPFWARITAVGVDGLGTPCYSWSELWDDGAGNFGVLHNGRSGVANGASSTNQAYEVHLSGSVPVNEIVTLWLTYDRLHYEFWYVSAGASSTFTGPVTFSGDTVTVVNSTWNLGTLGNPATWNFQFGSLIFPSTSVVNTAPSAILVIPTLTAAQPSKPTWTAQAGELICAGNYLYQYTGPTTVVTYPPTNYANIITQNGTGTLVVPVWNPATNQYDLPNLIQINEGTSTITLPTGVTEVFQSGSTITLQTGTTFNNQTTTTYSSSYVGTFQSGSTETYQSGSSITVNQSASVTFQTTSSAGTAPGKLNLPTLTGTSSAPSWTPGAGTYPLEWNPTTHTLYVWDGSAWDPLGSDPLTTKGDIWCWSTTDARLPVGTNGQILSADSTQATGLKWITSGAGLTSPLTTKGDLWAFGTADDRLPVGANATILTADSAQTDGLKWDTAANVVSNGGGAKTTLSTPTGNTVDAFATVTTVTNGNGIRGSHSLQNTGGSNTLFWQVTATSILTGANGTASGTIAAGAFGGATHYDSTIGSQPPPYSTIKVEVKSNTAGQPTAYKMAQSTTY